MQVSVFLKTNAQQQNGRFVIPTGGPVPNGFEVPGAIRLFNVHVPVPIAVSGGIFVLQILWC